MARILSIDYGKKRTGIAAYPYDLVKLRHQADDTDCLDRFYRQSITSFVFILREAFASHQETIRSGSPR